MAIAVMWKWKGSRWRLVGAGDIKTSVFTEVNVGTLDKGF
jgi:hypothetical protein